MTTMKHIDEKALKEALSVLKQNGDVYEIRALAKGKVTFSGYFNDSDIALNELKRLDLTGMNVYFTLGSVNSDCFSREQSDRFVKNPANSTSDNDVYAYEWILVDFDPQRATGTSSSDEELEAAKDCAIKVGKFLKNRGFSYPIFAMSGNGYHLLYKVSFESTEENKEIVKKFLQALSMLFSTKKISVDVKNFNPSRICKLYGTLSQKGTNKPERPFRMSRIIKAPEPIQETDIGFFRKVAEMLPEKPKAEKYNGFSPEAFDVVSFLQKHGVGYREVSCGDYVKYLLDECPFDSQHTKGDAMVTKGKDGALGFSCFHNSCSGNHWREFRMHFEPDAYERKEAYERKKQGEDDRKVYNRDKARYKVKGDEQPTEAKTPREHFMSPLQILSMPKENATFIKTGTTEIDRRMRGLKKGAVSLVSGLRSSAKSTWLSQVAINAINDGYRTMIYSGELVPRNFIRWFNLQVAGKHFAKATEYPNYFYVTEETEKKIAEWVGDKLLLYNNLMGNDFGQIREHIETVAKEANVDLVIIDNLMTLDIDGFDERDKYNAQKLFMRDIGNLAKRSNIHIVLVAHPRKSTQFLRLQDIAGTNDLVNMADAAFIVHRNNRDFETQYTQYFGKKAYDALSDATNVIEIAKDRETGNQDVFVPLWYETETKRMRNSKDEFIQYGWIPDYGYGTPVDDDDIPF